MSVLERTSHHGPFTWGDLQDLPADSCRREVIEGTLIVSPPPVPRHQRVSFRLGTVLDRCGTDGLEVMVAPVAYRYDEDNWVEPDLLVVRSDDVHLDAAFITPAVPVLLVEVLSPSNHAYDRLLKRDLYQRLGVPAYWIVDPGAVDREPSILALRLVDGAYETEAEASGSGLFESEDPFPVSFAPADLLRA